MPYITSTNAEVSEGLII